MTFPFPVSCGFPLFSFIFPYLIGDVALVVAGKIDALTALITPNIRE
jgi:hypothetical protein